MARDYGIDMSCVRDFDPVLRDVTGKRLLAEALVRRITTPRGMLLDDPNYGIDVRDYLSMEMTRIQAARLRAAVRAELEKDERVARASVDTSFVHSTSTLTMTILVDTDEGETLTLVLAVSAVSVEVLTVE